jgi:hypothetical protein
MSGILNDDSNKECPLGHERPGQCPRCAFGESVRETGPLMKLQIWWMCNWPNIVRYSGKSVSVNDLSQLKDRYDKGMTF